MKDTNEPLPHEDFDIERKEVRHLAAGFVLAIWSQLFYFCSIGSS